jgi:hypothetical protein
MLKKNILFLKAVNVFYCDFEKGGTAGTPGTRT